MVEKMTAQISDQLINLAVPIDSLNEDPANARVHNEKNMQSIKSSLARFGQRAPIVVNSNGNIVEAGNGRLVAARAMGWTHIAAVFVDDDAVTAASYAIADNRTAELAEWDDDALSTILATLCDCDEPLAELGWCDEDIDAILDPLPVDVFGEHDGTGAAGSPWRRMDDRPIKPGVVCLIGDVEFKAPRGAIELWEMELNKGRGDMSAADCASAWLARAVGYVDTL